MAMAATISARITEETSALRQQHGLVPGLAVVIVGEDAASQVYVRNKQRTAEACGFHSVKHALPATVGEAELLELIDSLNGGNGLNGATSITVTDRGGVQSFTLNTLDAYETLDELIDAWPGEKTNSYQLLTMLQGKMWALFYRNVCCFVSPHAGYTPARGRVAGLAPGVRTVRACRRGRRRGRSWIPSPFRYRGFAPGRRP